MAAAVYILCALTSLVCAALLVRGYRQSRSRLLFWSAVCFCGLFLNNLLLVVDLVVVREIDLASLRSGIALVAVGVLIWGLVSVASQGGRS